MVFTILFFTIALASLIIIMLTRFPFRRVFCNKNSAVQLIGGFTSKAEFKSVCIETPAWRKFIEVPVPSREVILLQPFNYITQIPGKNVRTKLGRGFNYWLNIPEDKLLLIEEIVQMLHNASLLLDDIQDNSILRRGIPVAHSIFGVPSTINTANYVIFLALEKVLNLNHPDATRVYTEQLLELHRGQGMEIYWRDTFTCPTEEEYSEMTIKKTGGLFMLAIRLMQLFSENKEDFTELTGILGLSFQILDDYLNLISKEYSDNKSYCEDLSEGKFSFPIIHAVNNMTDQHQIIHILRQRTKDYEVKKYCVGLLEGYGSFEYTKTKLKGLRDSARAEVVRLGTNPVMESVINDFFKILDEDEVKK